MAGDVWFYHLTRRTLEDAVPDLLEKCRARDWRVTLRAGSAERAEALNARLWTFRDDSFLPHGTAADGFAARQPIYLTAGPETPNDPAVLFLVDGAEATAAEAARFERVVTVFDGRDETAVQAARAFWRAVVAAGASASYWAEERGGWTRKAQSGG